MSYILSLKSDTVDLAASAMNNQSYQADLGDRRVVSPKAGSEMAAALGLQYFESSAKDQTGVEVRSLRTEQMKDGRSPQKWCKHAILMRIRPVCSFHLIHPNVQEPFFYLANEWHKVHGEQAASMAEIA